LPAGTLFSNCSVFAYSTVTSRKCEINVIVIVKYKSLITSDVKRGQNLEAEAEAEAEADGNFWRLRPRPRPKII